MKIMTINVDALYAVTPVLEPRRPSSLDLTVSMDDSKLWKLFFQVWEYAGEEKLNKWLNSEGYSLMENKLTTTK